MAHVTRPRLGESTTTTGTGPFALAGALTAHKRFSAECSVADTLWGNIAAVDSSGNETGDWVEGLMTYSAANEITVTTVYKSSNSDLAVTFGAGTKYVTLIADARQIAAVPRGGSAGQALTKINSTDYNTQWADATNPVLIQLACSDETTALATGTAKVTFRAPYAFTLTGVRASVTTAPTGGTLLTVDVNESGTTVLSTKLTFDAGEKTTTTAATPAVISDSAIADDAEITIDIDAVGSTIAGAGLKVALIGTKP